MSDDEEGSIPIERRIVRDKTKPVFTPGLIIGIALIAGLIAIIAALVIVGSKAQAADEERKRKEKAAKDAADKAAKERDEKEKAERAAEEAERKRQEELNKKPEALEWIGQESYCAVNGIDGIGILSSTWVDGGPGHWDNMRLLFRVENGKALESTMPPGLVYNPVRVLSFVLELEKSSMALGLKKMLVDHFANGIKGTVLFPAWYELQEWTIKVSDGKIVMSARAPNIISGAGRNQPTVLFAANNIRGKP